MDHTYAFNQVADAHSPIAADKRTIFIFEMIKETPHNSAVQAATEHNAAKTGSSQTEVYPTKYSVDDINRILESKHWSDHFAKAILIKKMMELQTLKNSEGGDYAERYNVLLDSLSQEAITNIRQLKHNIALGDPLDQDSREVFVQKFYADWANQTKGNPKNYNFGGRLKGLDL